jgi:uncharacterized protein DUF3108
MSPGAKGRDFVLAIPRHLRRALHSAALLAAFLTAAPGAACAQGKLDARYSATLAGIPIGKGNWIVNITDTNYVATANGMTTGLIHAFAGGEGTGAVHGAIQAGQPSSATYESTIVTRKKTDEVRLTLQNGAVKESKIVPPLETEPERVPITEAHQRGILDPMTASLLRIPGNGDLLSPESCHRQMAIFDGRLRYDLQLAFKRIDHVKADSGYAGPVLVCAVYFTPVAGFIPSRSAIRYITSQRDIEVWLAPLAGTRVLVPFRAQGPTPIGRFVVEATQFVATPVPARASANGVKTQ